ncbi:MAG: hypothetical protein ACK5C5_09875 [Bacteroidota bacterium]|jgi:hypothetical protein
MGKKIRKIIEAELSFMVLNHLKAINSDAAIQSEKVLLQSMKSTVRRFFKGLNKTELEKLESSFSEKPGVTNSILKLKASKVDTKSKRKGAVLKTKKKVSTTKKRS